MAAATLSPSRATDFMQCPLLFRFRVLDRLPEAPSRAAARGTAVHAVLERLFDLPAARRTPGAAAALLGPEWARLLTESPELELLFGDDADALARWLREAENLLLRWFDLEDPTRLEPADRELRVHTTIRTADAGELQLRGVMDRLDVAADGRVRIVDYKTGRAPGPGYEGAALFQLKFYALVLWRLRGVVPSVLQLVYLGSGEVLRYEPDEQDLLATERKLLAVWAAVEAAARRGDWRPSPSPRCGWCDHRARCPAQGGVAPPVPAGAAERLLGTVDP